MRLKPVMPALRWAFDCVSWAPTKPEWMLASQCLQPEEKQRIGKFYYKKDARSAIAGRLLLRKAAAEVLNIPYKDVKLGRTEKGKPYLMNEVDQKFSFNVSHQGSWAVLAADTEVDVGVDVMKIERPRGKSVERFISTMQPQFTVEELDAIRSSHDEWSQLAMFYRHWCLKESYVKTLGIGIGFDVHRLGFRLNTDILSENTITTDTEVHVDGKLNHNWRFEETVLDKFHCVSTALNADMKVLKDKKPVYFTVLTFEDLTTGSQTLSEPDLAYWENFSGKDENAWTK